MNVFIALKGSYFWFLFDPAEMTRGRVDSRAEMETRQADPLPWKLPCQKLSLSLRILKNGQKCTAARENQQNHICAKQRLRSAWAYAPSDQSLRYMRSEGS